MSITQEIHAEGMQQGMQRGIQTGMQRVAERLISQNKNIHYIANLTDLSLEQIEEMQKKMRTFA